MDRKGKKKRDESCGYILLLKRKWLCKLNYDISLKCVTFLLFRTNLMYVLNMPTPESFFWGCFQRLLDLLLRMSLYLSEFQSKTLQKVRGCPRLRIIICPLFFIKYFLMRCQSSGMQIMPTYPVLNNRERNKCLRITEWLRLEGTSGGLSQAGPPRSYFPGPYPYDFWIPPRMETSQSPWATCVSAWSPTQ